jgi:hypothetical protein
LWPWDVPPAVSGLPETEPAFDAAIRDGKRADLGEKNYERAIGFYRQAAEIAKYDRQRASARLVLAGALLRSGDRRGAAAAYRAVLKLPSAVLDEEGLASWSVAALPLLELKAHTADVLERLRTDVESRL